MNNADMKAMPVNWMGYDGLGQQTIQAQEGGMTKREAFTKTAMAAILSNRSMIDNLDEDALKWVVEGALKVADLQLQALEES